MLHRPSVLFTTSLLLTSVIGTLTAHATDTTPISDDLSDSANVEPAIHVTRLDYSEWDVPEAVTVITAEDIRVAGYLEISEIFRAVPGFRLAKIGDESRLSYHGTAARQNRRMLITIDGRSVLIGDGQYVEFDRLPIDIADISRITITRGPNGAAYSDNAFLTHIDFQTIGRDDPRGLTIRAGGGYNGRRKLSALANEQLGRIRVTVSAGSERDGGYDYYDAEGTPRDDGLTIKRGRLTLESELSPQSRWRLDASMYDSEHRTGIRTLSFSGHQWNDGHFVALSNEREIGETSRLDWFLSHNRQREDIRNTGCYTPEAIAQTRASIADPELAAAVLSPSLFVPTLLGTTLADTCFFVDLGVESTRTEAEVEYESQHGPWRYVLGVSAGHTEAKSPQFFAGAKQRQRTYRLFSESAVTLGRAHVSVGIMAQDSSNVSDTELAWRGALNWQLLRNQSVRYSYARSFRVPSLVESETAWTAAFYFGDRNQALSSYPVRLTLPLITRVDRLVPETIDSHAIGYFGAFQRLTLDVKLFNEQIRDPVLASQFYFSPPPLNGEGFRLRGVESEVTVNLSPRWRLSGQHSYLDSDATNEIERGLHGRHAGSLLVTYRPASDHAVSLGYYGNSTISGNSYDRYDLVYNYSRTLWGYLLRSQIILQHHIGGVDGIRDPGPLGSNEGYFRHMNQLFFHVELNL